MFGVNGYGLEPLGSEIAYKLRPFQYEMIINQEI